MLLLLHTAGATLLSKASYVTHLVSLICLNFSVQCHSMCLLEPFSSVWTWIKHGVKPGQNFSNFTTQIEIGRQLEFPVWAVTLGNRVNSWMYMCLKARKLYSRKYRSGHSLGVLRKNTFVCKIHLMYCAFPFQPLINDYDVSLLGLNSLYKSDLILPCHTIISACSESGVPSINLGVLFY